MMIALEMAIVVLPLALLFAGLFPSDHSSPRDLDRVAEVIRARRETGDAVFLFGGEAASPFFAGLPSVARGPAAGVLHLVGQGLPRLWLVDARPDRSARPRLGLPAALEVHRFPEVTLSLHQILRDPFLRHLPAAEVEVREAETGSRHRCSSSASGELRCPAGGAQVSIRPARMTIGGEFLECVRADLPAAGALLLRFPRMPIRDLLFLRTGSATDRPVRIEIAFGGEGFIAFTHRTKRGWESRVLATRGISGTTRDLELLLSAPAAPVTRSSSAAPGPLTLCLVGGT
jgi:hypothetical protein